MQPLIIISGIDDKQVFAEVESMKHMVRYATITFKIDVATYYKLLKEPDKITHEAKLIVYSKDQYREELKKLS